MITIGGLLWSHIIQSWLKTLLTHFCLTANLKISWLSTDQYIWGKLLVKNMLIIPVTVIMRGFTPDWTKELSRTSVKCEVWENVPVILWFRSQSASSWFTENSQIPRGCSIVTITALPTAVSSLTTTQRSAERPSPVPWPGWWRGWRPSTDSTPDTPTSERRHALSWYPASSPPTNRLQTLPLR